MDKGGRGVPRPHTGQGNVRQTLRFNVQFNSSSSQFRPTIGVARILSGGAPFAKKVDDLFLVVALKDCLNLPQKPRNKNCPKIDSCSGWRCTSCPAGVHLHIFPVN